MRILLILLSFFLLTSSIRADHFMSGNISYACLSDDAIQLDIQILIEEGTDSGATIDHPALIYVYRRDFGTIEYEEFSTFGLDPDETEYLYYPLLQKEFQRARYFQNFDDFTVDGEYLFVYQRCCRNEGLTNIDSSQNVGTSLMLEIDFENGQVVCNRAPTLTDQPLLSVFANESFNLQLPIIEIEGDSLVYTYDIMSVGGGDSLTSMGCQSPAPHIYCPPPYDLVPMTTGFSFDSPFGVDADVILDFETGELIGVIPDTGRFAFAVQVAEYRDGELLGNIHFDLQLDVLPTDICELDLLLDSQEDVNQLGALGCFPILGDLTITGDEVVDLTPLQDLTSIGGNLTIEFTPNLSNLDGLHHLQYLGGDLTLYAVGISNLDDLSDLTFIGGGLLFRQSGNFSSVAGLPAMEAYDFVVIENCPVNSLQGLESVDTVRNEWRMSLVDLSMAPTSLDLKHIGGNFQMQFCLVDDYNIFDQLEYVGGDFDIRGFGNIETFDDFLNLKTIGGKIELQRTSGSLPQDVLNSITAFSGLEGSAHITIKDFEALESIDIFHSLDTIADINLVNLDELKTLDGFEQVVFASDDLRFNSVQQLERIPNFAALVEVDGLLEINNLDGLVEILGFDNLIKAESIVIEENSALKNLAAFPILESVAEDFSIEYNSVLESIDGFGTLDRTGEFVIRSNALLNNIEGFQNLLEVNGIFRVRNNSALNSCDIFCPLLTDGVVTNFISMRNNGVAGTCFFPGVCTLSLIEGNLFLDENENGIHEWGDEILLNNTGNLISTIPAPNQSFVEVDGKSYKFIVELGNYEFVANNPSLWRVSDSLQMVEIANSSEEIYHDIGLIPVNLVSSAESFIAGTATNRCDEPADFNISVRNTGTQKFSGKVTFTFDDKLEFISSTNPIDSIFANQLTWNISELDPTDQVSFTTSFNMPGADFIGDTLQFSSTMFDENMDSVNNFKFSSIVTCSYDPNDKLTHPDRPGEENKTLFDESIVYTIRFENIGNDFARNVKIVDTLSSDLNLNSFEFIGSSHNVSTVNINENSRILSIYFNNINLDAGQTLSGEPIVNAENTGFFQFRMKPIDGLQDFHVIENTAAIYFDGNDPIITNTAINTMVSDLTISGLPPNVENNPLGLKVFPNPSNDIFNITAKQIYDNLTYTVLDVFGRKVFEGKIDLGYSAEQISIPVEAGVYFLEVNDLDKGEKSLVQIVKMN